MGRIVDLETEKELVEKAMKGFFVDYVIYRNPKSKTGDVLSKELRKYNGKLYLFTISYANKILEVIELKDK